MDSQTAIKKSSVNKITDAISNEKIAVINAKTDEERIAAQERVNTLQARRDVLIAESAVSRLNIWIRAGFASGPLVVLIKLFVWDKAIGSLVGCSQALKGTCLRFTTDSLDDNQWHVIWIVVGFYFLYEGAVPVTRIAKA